MNEKACSPKPTKKRIWALLVGVERYKDPRIWNLKYSLNDVLDLDRVLRLIYREQELHCVTLTDLEDNSLLPRKENILREIGKLSSLASWDDLVLIHLIGHGSKEGGIFYFLPSDADMDRLPRTAISIRELRSHLEGIKAHHKVLIIDACHSGSGWAALPKENLEGRTYEDELTELGKEWAVLASCKHDEISNEFEDEKHGAFTYCLLLALGAALEGKQTFTLFQLVRFIRKELRARLEGRGLPEQTPHLISFPFGDIPLIPQQVKASKELRIGFLWAWLRDCLQGPRGLLPVHFWKLLMGTALLVSGIFTAEAWCTFRCALPGLSPYAWLLSAASCTGLIIPVSYAHLTLPTKA